MLVKYITIGLAVLLVSLIIEQKNNRTPHGLMNLHVVGPEHFTAILVSIFIWPLVLIALITRK